ncbi:MAG: hypothetical protein A2026_22430 [Deltaproteobacteria bacterium RBG_19FT_COMBO_46_12]|nr:MAG: hypothetical protein A2026_22430 [Deltaproteobacteria bacterium RBG_19FT_COMBO_46_12]
METEKKTKGKKEVVRLGLIYDVEHQRFDTVYKDLTSNEIQIGPYYDQEGQEVHTSTSAA